MRQAFNDVGFILGEGGQVVGLSLGYDSCWHHEEAAKGIQRYLGMDIPTYPLGVEDRQMKAVPGNLFFVKFKQKPRDRRRQAYPVAVLALVDAWKLHDQSPEQIAREAMVNFGHEPHDKRHKPEDDLATAWNQSEFLVQVRGEENIRRLETVFNAFQSMDIVLAVPWAKSFFRGGLSFVISSAMPEAAKQEVLNQDRANIELRDAARATGIYELLEAAGKSFIVLSPSWFDSQKDEVVFFLNPSDQRRYQFGWFSVEELKEWARDQGPIMRYKELEEFAQRPEHYNWSCRLLSGMNAKGIKPRHHEHLVWMDEAKTIPGLRFRATRDTEHVLPSGDYAFADLMDKYAEPLADKATA